MMKHGVKLGKVTEPLIIIDNMSGYTQILHILMYSQVHYIADISRNYLLFVMKPRTVNNSSSIQFV